PDPVEQAEIGAWGSRSRAGLTASRSDVEAALAGHLAATGFHLVAAADGEEAPEGALKLTLDVPMAQADPPRVGVLLQVRRRSGAGSARYEAEGIGEALAGSQG